MDTPLPCTAADIARERLHAFLEKEIADIPLDRHGEALHQMYTYLLGTARCELGIVLKSSPSPDYMYDEAAAAQNRRLAHPERFVTPRPKVKRSSGKLRSQPAN